MDLFGDRAAILISIILKSYYGMLKGNISLCMYLSIVNFSGHEIKIVVVVIIIH